MQGQCAALIYVDGKVSDKRVYAGDISNAEASLESSGLDFVFFENDEDPDYLSAEVGDEKP